MTIDEVMELADAYADASTEFVIKGVAGSLDARVELRAAILALIDAEAEACAEVCDQFDACLPEHIAKAIRARIAARKGGKND